MLRRNLSVSGCVYESPVARSTATLAPNVGLYAARDAEWELVRTMEDLVAAYSLPLIPCPRAALRLVEGAAPGPGTSAVTTARDPVSTPPVPAPRLVVKPVSPVPARTQAGGEASVPCPRTQAGGEASAPCPRTQAGGEASVPGPCSCSPCPCVGGEAAACGPCSCGPCPCSPCSCVGGEAAACGPCSCVGGENSPRSPRSVSLVGGEADACRPYTPWSGSQGARAASPTCPASWETQWVGWLPLLVREWGE